MAAGLVIALDVDGVLAPWLDVDHGRMLLDTARDLNAQLVWATGHGEQANRWVGPAIGLPDLPVVDMTGAEPVRVVAHWKASRIAAYAGQRPLVWLDDEFQAADYTWAELRSAYGAPTLLVPVDERTGLDSSHLAAIRAWAGSGRTEP
jgi:hypothetical protein